MPGDSEEDQTYDDKPLALDEVKKRLKEIEHGLKRALNRLKLLHTYAWPQITNPLSGTTYPHGAQVGITVQSNKTDLTHTVTLTTESGGAVGGVTAQPIDFPVDGMTGLKTNPGHSHAPLQFPNSVGDYLVVCTVSGGGPGGSDVTVKIAVSTS
jgi:hypothetical protein